MHKGKVLLDPSLLLSCLECGDTPKKVTLVLGKNQCRQRSPHPLSVVFPMVKEGSLSGEGMLIHIPRAEAERQPEGNNQTPASIRDQQISQTLPLWVNSMLRLEKTYSQTLPRLGDPPLVPRSQALHSHKLLPLTCPIPRFPVTPTKRSTFPQALGSLDFF